MLHTLAPMVGPIVGLIADQFRTRSPELAKQTGLPESAVAQVGEALHQALTRDERLHQQLAEEMQRARAHEAATTQQAPPVVELLRGLVRPVITFTAFFWYVAARAQGIELGAEDYAIIGGIVAFWFGFRPFEKRRP